MVDVTGGIAEKLRTAAAVVAVHGIPVYIVQVGTEHAAEALDRARQLALDSANRLAKEVPAKVSSWRGELQSKAMLKANPTKAASGYSLFFGSKKALAKAEPDKAEAGLPSEEESAQGEKVSPYFF